MQTSEYCREIETYLCRKNDGHLIRVVGPSFELVSGWASRGVPLKVAFSGIDRSFDRYHRKGPRRRPLKIDFCDADVLEAFDEWRRAVGISKFTADLTPEAADAGGERRPAGSLPAHLERALRRLSSARAQGHLDESFDAMIDALSAAHDQARAVPAGLRGTSRQRLMEQLATLDLSLVKAAHGLLDEPTRTALMTEAAAQLSSFRDRMAPDAYEKARSAAFDRLVRDACGLPTLAFHPSE